MVWERRWEGLDDEEVVVVVVVGDGAGLFGVRVGKERDARRERPCSPSAASAGEEEEAAAAAAEVGAPPCPSLILSTSKSFLKKVLMKPECEHELESKHRQSED